MYETQNEISEFHKGQILTEGLILIREDICDWITTLFKDECITGKNFLLRLQSGVMLCELLKKIYQEIPPGKMPINWPKNPPKSDNRATSSCFKARDNISIFLNWCRAAGLRNTILFETKGLMQKDEEKNVVLTLLHLGEICVDLDIPVPQFARFKKEIDVEQMNKGRTKSTLTSNDAFGKESNKNEINFPTLKSNIDNVALNKKGSLTIRQQLVPKTYNDDILKTMVTEVSKRSGFDKSFTIESISMHSGMYRIGTKNIYVRMFKKNVMLRIGGGWETLNEYLNKVELSNKSPTKSQSISNIQERNLTPENMSAKELKQFNEANFVKVKVVKSRVNTKTPNSAR